ncbi:MAG: DUF1524 domain-containing protein, partial [Actinomycetales bacterium]|nr:DUF1524 domain-containing protein [Actinomycetales bacterium]
MPTKKRLWLGGTIAVLILLPVVSIGSAFSAVQSMQTAGTVDSLETALGETPSPIDISVPTESSTSSTSAPATQSAQLNNTGVATFLSMLEQLPTDDAPSTHTGYKRDYFNAWIDADGDGCNTRAEVLMMESQTAVTTRGSCTVSTGQWTSAYDGVTLTDASGLDIDHFVPLNEAWGSGAYGWDNATRVSYGNDLGYDASLLAVTASSNRSKSDKDPAQWMPASHGYFCDYAATWVAVKWRWSLTVDSLERMTLQSVLNGCSTVSIAIPEKAVVTAGAAPEAVAPVSDGVLDPNYGT